MKSHKNRKKYVAILVVLVVIIGAALFFWASSGNNGQIGTVTETSPDQAPATKQLDGKYIAFEHKGTYQSQTIEAKGGDLELYLLRASTTYEKQLAVSVSQLPGGRLDSNSAYLLRQSQTSAYTRQDTTIAGSPAVIWTKNDGKEQTVFITRGDTVAVLAFTTAGNVDNLQPEVENLTKTFRWK